MMSGPYRFGIFFLSWLGSLVALAAAALSLEFAPADLAWLSWPAAAVMAAIAAFGVARLSVAPIVAATHAARRLAEGEETACLPESRSTAVSELADAFNALADSLRKRLTEAGKAAAERAEALSGAMDELHARDETRSREAHMAVRMQRRIVPRAEELPERRETAFGSVYLPAENTGGDLYDASRAGKNGLALLAADVSGRGVTAALIAAMVKNAFRTKAGWDGDPAAIMTAVDNELLPILGDTDHFVTAFFALLDLETGLLRFAAAGHPPALHYRRRTGEVEDLDAAGPPLGLQSEGRFVAGERRLEEGDRLLLFTDGLTGARNYRGESFGRDRLVAAYIKAATRPAIETASAVSAALESFLIGAPRSDDVVALVCEFRRFARPEDAARRRLTEREDWHVLARRGSELAAAGKVEEAIGVYERILELEPEDAPSLNNLGTLYWRLGRREEAATRFEAAARIDPADPRIQRNLVLAEHVFAARRAAEAEPVEDAEPVGNDEVEDAEPLGDDDDTEDAEPVEYL